jgi:hypothetical protein
MRINCPSCGRNVDLDDAYDHYEGPFKCCVCKAMLEIHTEEGSIKAVEQVNIVRRASTEQVSEPVLNPRKDAAQRAGASGSRSTE